MENGGKSLKPRANYPAASREELRPSISGGINDQEQEHCGHGHLDRLEKVNLGEELALLVDIRACCLRHGEEMDKTMMKIVGSRGHGTYLA